MPGHEVSETSLKQLLAAAGHAVEGLDRLAGDVSLRRYFRARSSPGSTAILAVYPVDVPAGCRRFVATTRLLEKAAVRVPEILAADCARGWMLIEDLGEQTLYEPQPSTGAELLGYLHRAADLQQRIAAIPRAAVAPLNPPLDEALLRRELDQAWELGLVPRRLTGGESLGRRLRRSLDELCAALAEAEPLPAHRDFMARNLVPVGDPPGLAVLDHQDLRLAPPGYDLASLLNDSIFPSPAIEREILRRWAPTPPQRRRYHLAAVQRTLKAIGTYESFARRGFSRHLPLVGPTLERTLRHLSSLPQTASLAADLEPIWSPLWRHGSAPESPHAIC